MAARVPGFGQLIKTRLYGNFKIVAIGRNFAAHAKELANDVPKEPFFFLKPSSSALNLKDSVEIPPGIDAHHEVELGVVISKKARDVLPTDARSYIGAYTLAVDMTARNLQDQVKKKGLPWSAAKGFDTFTPLSRYVKPALVEDPHNLRLKLSVNDVVKQDGTTADMIFKIPDLISHISSIMTLFPGDIILTGTPSGVGPVVPGDKVHCELRLPNGVLLSDLSFGVVARNGLYSFKPEAPKPSS